MSRFCRGCGGQLLLKDRYRPVQPIGRGGFGRTFLAVDEHLPSQPKCVVKQLCFSEQDPEIHNKAVELFHQEAVRLDELGNHPQIPQLLAHFEQAQRLYLVQEFIEGQTLAAELQQGTFNEGQIWELLKDLLPVLQFVHARQVIHRDIKPANLIRCRCDNRIVLIDFGVAKLIAGTALLHTGTAIGSPEYIAPEQTRGKALPASDLYSLGVTCIHLLTSISPFELFDSASNQWAWRDYLLPDNLVSDRLGPILDKLLQNALNQRYKSAVEVLQALTPKSSTKSAHHQGSNVSSQAGVNCKKLHDLLAAGKWQQADLETWAVMCHALSKPPGSYLHSGDIDRFPYEDLVTIDHLWVKYSRGHFGFSVQKQIYESVDGDYGSFCDRVGWHVYNSTSNSEFKFSTSAPLGHLPSRIWVGGPQWWRHAAALAAKLAS